VNNRRRGEKIESKKVEKDYALEAGKKLKKLDK
jgi:hypothetical protein